MLRQVAKWFISRSIDEDGRLPDWLRHRIDRDEELKQFEMLSRQLGARLKNDAPDWIANQALPAGGESAGRQRIVAGQPASLRHERRAARSLAAGALTTGALAACAWFAIARLQSQPVQLQQPLSGGDDRMAQKPATATLTAADREWLATAWNTGRANLGQLRAQARDLPRRAEVLKQTGISAVVQPAEVAGSTAGRALATLDHSMETEKQQLTSDMKTAYSFFAYRLPASLARMVGRTL